MTLDPHSDAYQREHGTLPPWVLERRSPTRAEHPQGYADALAAARARYRDFTARRDWYLSMAVWRASYHTTLAWLEWRIARLERGIDLWQYEPYRPETERVHSPAAGETTTDRYTQLGLFEQEARTG